MRLIWMFEPMSKQVVSCGRDDAAPLIIRLPSLRAEATRATRRLIIGMGGEWRLGQRLAA